jgi:hypothetical protein
MIKSKSATSLDKIPKQAADYTGVYRCNKKDKTADAPAVSLLREKREEK